MSRAPARYARAGADARPFDGRVAFVAGGYGGIGEAIAVALARGGATVVVAGRDGGRLEAAVAGLRRVDANASGATFDARSVTSIGAAVDAAVERHGRVDLLVNCAAIHVEESVLDVTEAAWDRVQDVNLKGAMFLGQAVARAQVARGGGGRHVHLLSVRAQLAVRGRGFSSYASSKGGLAMLVRQHAVELAPHGITVNGVAPTVVRTAMAGRWLSDPAIREALLARIPLGRIAEVDDVVGPVLFFCGPGAAFVTGQILYVDGGITASQ
ncbi:2-dehydro-3-deoxy-D-gluconate 5-dehydrogenase [Burkholderiales bacterium]|nr:2-dehydro-3-deoxy-D-gluconate 5-dehydrogenase [Burkholderiales bacterium]